MIATKAARVVKAALGRGRGRVRNAARAFARSRRAGRTRGLHRRLRRHQQHRNRDALRHSGVRHVRAFLGDVVRARARGVRAASETAGRKHGLPDRQLRHARRRAPRRGAWAVRCGACASIAAIWWNWRPRCARFWTTPAARREDHGHRRSERIQDSRAGGRAARPSTSFGVGTELATSADAPSLGVVYKMVELERAAARRRYTLKLSEDKHTLPGAKQIFRYADHDVLARSSECPSCPPGSLRRPKRCCGR